MFEKIFEGVDGLNESLIAKMKPIFEAAVEEKVQSRIDEATSGLNEEIGDLREQLAEAAAYNSEAAAKVIAEKFDQFLSMTVIDWANKNSIGIQNEAINQLSQVFMASIVESAKKFNVTIPEGEESKLDLLESQLATTRSRLNDALSHSVSITEELTKMKKKAIVESVSKGMTAVSAGRLMERCMKAAFEDETSFKELCEGYRVIVEKSKVEEDDLFDDGKPRKSKQNPDGTMGEEFVDGTDKDYPMNIKENGDMDDEDEEEEDEESEEAKKIGESAVNNLRRLGLIK
jgi:hypothetical protein